MEQKTTFAIFKNEKLKLFHIWNTKQENPEVNVNVVNAFSKASYALSGKDAGQCAATTSFLRVISSTKKEDWDVEYVELGVVDKNIVRTEYEQWIQVLTELGYICITRDLKVRIQSGKYAGRKWKATIIQNLSTQKVIKHVENMMKDCFVKDDIIKSDASSIGFGAVYGKLSNDVKNISELWSYVFNQYSEYADKDVA